MAPDMARDWPETVTLAAKQAEFDALVRQHRGITFKVASAYAPTPEDRQDLVQEIVAQVWRAFPHYDPTRNFSTWMYRIALNVAISLVGTRRCASGMWRQWTRRRWRRCPGARPTNPTNACAN